ncbi:hypothetical protein SG34_032435 [Thalassomonas viridans]|uniref:Uncharacterized protein n=1 Tax=Thalassomonas viridans TaxID=137584 RepID=A0AAE9Z9T1_9GAMM|nr:hypothetical protein [Thalassomonas viridans]WDE08629.1 hypothetical protein SG34_032435 [Thalassomonas viridans]
MSIKLFEQKDLEALKALKSHPDFYNRFDIVEIQRELKLDFSTAACLKDFAIKNGLLRRDKEIKTLVHFKI